MIKRGDIVIDKFTKSDLKNRMVVETKNHLFYIVIGEWLVGETGSIKLDSYSYDLYNYYNKHDIIRVYYPVYRLDGFIQHPIDLHTTVTNSCMRLLWERTSVKEVTMAEIEEKFGCKVKIVNGDNSGVQRC